MPGATLDSVPQKFGDVMFSSNDKQPGLTGLAKRRLRSGADLGKSPSRVAMNNKPRSNP
jgi:hypothetical protein